MPRGFGKSLTYQALPLICDTVRGTTGHIVVVVSPLVYLVKDQATKLANIGIPAVTLNDISEENMKVVERGASLLFTAPRSCGRLLSEVFHQRKADYFTLNNFRKKLYS